MEAASCRPVASVKAHLELEKLPEHLAFFGIAARGKCLLSIADVHVRQCLSSTSQSIELLQVGF